MPQDTQSTATPAATMELIPAEIAATPADVFKPEGVDSVLGQIEAKGRAEVDGATVETASGISAIKSTAYKIARSKTFLDEAGKSLVADWKARAKKVDESRRKIRERLDDLRDEIRRPLTEWEEAEKARKEAEKLAAEIESAHETAIEENRLFDERRALERQRAEMERKEAERRAVEEKARAEAERKERERRIAEEAAARAKAESEAKVRAAEEARIRAEAQAEARAKAESEEAVRKERERAQLEARRKAEEEEKARAEAERKAMDQAHRSEVDRIALEALRSGGIGEFAAKKVIRLVASGKVPGIRMEY